MPPAAVCRLCSTPLHAVESRRQLCAVCDDYVQHLSLRGNQRFEQTLSTVRDFWLFRQASKQAH